MLGLSLIVTGILLIIVLNLVLFVFYKQVITATMLLVILFFTLSIFGALSALFIPSIYETVTEEVIEETGFGKQIKSVDSVLTDVSSVPGNIQNTVEGIFGDSSNNESETEFQLYEQLINFFAGILRIFVLVISLLIMFITTYFRYSFAGVISSRNLEKKVSKLESRIAKMEKW